MMSDKFIPVANPKAQFEAYRKGIAVIHTILADFAFGLKDEIQLNTANAFIAHESLAPRLKEKGVSQARTSLGGGWDCYIPA
jgi:hypothetical protein